MAKKPTTPETTAAASGPVRLRYVGPAHVDSERFGALEPGRVYQETDPVLATYLVEKHPEHWERA